MLGVSEIEKEAGLCLGRCYGDLVRKDSHLFGIRGACGDSSS